MGNSSVYKFPSIYPGFGIYNSGSEYIEVGGKKYKTKKIGDLVWTTENLDYQTTQASGNVNHPEFGKYYPREDLGGISSLLEKGWRLPSLVDFQKLIESANASSSHTLQSLGYALWPNATNASGFSAVPARTSESAENQLDRAILWSTTLDNNLSQSCLLLHPDAIQFYAFTLGTELSVCARLCKSSTPKNLFNKETPSILKGYCGTIGNNFIVEANNGSQSTLIIPITDEMKGKRLRISCDLGDDVSNRWICGQVNEIPSSGRQTYGEENILFLSAARINSQRSYSDTLRAIGDYSYILFFFSSGVSDISKFINSLMICEDGNYYPYKNF